MDRKLTIEDILSLKGKRKITMLTAYDYPFASIIDEAGVDIILVGDSLANVVLGLNSTTEIGMSEMLVAAKAVTRAVKKSLVVGDMPYEAYQLGKGTSRYAPTVNARRFIDEAKCDAIKLEWFDNCIEVTREIIKENIPVMGHIGITPQTADKLGGFKVQGKDIESAKTLIDEAKKLEDAGCFSIVLECIPDTVSKIITSKLSIPTIGIGAGLNCDGQALVTYDILGLFKRFQPKFVKQYVDLSKEIEKAVNDFKLEVESQKFPDKAHSFNSNIKEKDL
ncbi:MAG: 3-methyl-2-oxobutanoate hydroxymethyltransferase [Candidatus Omnitrophota bacterium]